MYNFILPSGQEVDLAEMTGREEEILTNRSLLKTGEAIDQVMKNCVLAIGENTAPAMGAILDLLSGDRLFILVKLRQISLGETVDLELTCPICKAHNAVTVELENLAVTPYGDTLEFDCELPRSKKVVRFGYLNGHKAKELGNLDTVNVTSVMLKRIISIDEKPPSKKVMTELTMFDRSALRKAMFETDAGMDTEIETDCLECGKKIKTRLEAEQSFLYPNMG